MASNSKSDDKIVFLIKCYVCLEFYHELNFITNKLNGFLYKTSYLTFAFVLEFDYKKTKILKSIIMILNLK